MNQQSSIKANSTRIELVRGLALYRAHVHSVRKESEAQLGSFGVPNDLSRLVSAFIGDTLPWRLSSNQLALISRIGDETDVPLWAWRATIEPHFARACLIDEEKSICHYWVDNRWRELSIVGSVVVVAEAQYNKEVVSELARIHSGSGPSELHLDRAEKTPTLPGRRARPLDLRRLRVSKSPPSPVT